MKQEKNGVIVLLHGNSSSTNIFKNLNLNYPILKLELLGHEISTQESNSSKDFSFESQKAEILNCVKDIHEPILLVGNSLGGHLAIEIANEIPNVSGLMIFGTPPVKKPINFEEAFVQVDALNTFLNENPTISEIEQAASVAVHQNIYVDQIKKDFINSNPKVRSAVLEDITGGKWENQYQIFTQLDCPKTIISGDQDPSVNRNYLNEVVANSINDTQLISISECGHYPTLEKPMIMSDIINEMADKIFL